MKKIVPFAAAPLAAAALLCATPALPQDAPRTRHILEEKPGLRMILDDDGGRVETFRLGDAPRALEFHGGPVIARPATQLVFLGDWSGRAALKHMLQERVADAAHAAFRDCEKAGALAPLATGIAVDLAAPAARNDLGVQAALAKALRDGVLPRQNADAVTVVFLAPSLQLTLGGSADFDSYHSNFHADDAHVRYVVVPFRADNHAMGEAAVRSLARAIVNPDGDGWY